MKSNETTTLAPQTGGDEHEASDQLAAFESSEFGDAGLDPLGDAGVDKKFSGGIILVVTVVLTAVAGLLGMKKLADFSSTAGVDKEIESTIENFLESIGRGSDNEPIDEEDDDANQLLAVITESYTERQVPLRDVQRDPFVLETEDEPVDVGPVVVEDLGKRERERLRKERERKQNDRREEILSEAERIRVKAILGGSRPIANIGGSNVHVGETITSRDGEIVYRVTAIGDATVDLVSEDSELDLVVEVTISLDR